MIRDIFLKVIVIFLLIGAGFVMRKTDIIKDKASSAMSDLLFYFATPCMILDTMQERELTDDLMSDTIWSFGGFFVVTVILCAISFPLAKIFKVDEGNRGLYRMQIAFTNMGFMGIPLTRAIFGEYCKLIIILINTAFVAVMYTIGIFVVLYEPGKKTTLKDTIKKMFNAPMTASVAGLILFITGLRLPGPVNESIGMVSDMVVPLSMIVVGSQLADSRLKKLVSFENIKLGLISLIAVPALTLGIMLLLPAGVEVTMTMVFGMAMPSAALTVILADQFGKDAVLASEGVASTTFFSLITLPIWAMILTTALM